MTLNVPFGRRYLRLAADAYLILQPLLGALVFVSIFFGFPPLWLFWPMFLGPFVIRFHRAGVFATGKGKWSRLRAMLPRTPFDIPIAILLAGLLIGFVVGSNRLAAADGLQTYLVCILIYYTGVANGILFRWFWIFAFACTYLGILVVAVITFAQAGVGARVLFFNEWLYRLGALLPGREGLSLNVNALGSVAGTALPGLLAYVVYEKRVRPRFIAGILAAVTAFLLVMSASSSGLFAAAIGGCFVLLLWKPWTLVFVAAAALAGLYWIVSIYHPASQWSFLLPIATLIDRFEIWSHTLSLLSDRWLMGLGLGGFLEAYSQLTGTVTLNAHSNYFQVYTDAGLLGGLALVGGAVAAVRNGWRVCKTKETVQLLAMACLVALAAFAANSVFETFVTAPAVIEGTSKTVTSYHYVAIPYVWVVLALLVMGLRKPAS